MAETAAEALPANRRRVLVCAAHYLPHLGGVERYTRELWTRLVHRGWAVAVLTGNTDGALPREERDGLAIYRLPVVQVVDGRVPVLLPGPRLAAAARTLFDWSPAVVVTNTRFFSTSLLGMALAKRWQVPSLHIEHGSHHVPLGSRLADRLSALFDHTAGAWVVRSASRCVGVSHASARFLAHLGRPDGGVLHNGVDAAAYLAAGSGWRDRLRVPPGHRIVLYVGRLIEDKGLWVLLEAFDRLGQGPDVHLVVAGEGHLLPELRARCRGRGNVHVLGQVPAEEVPALLGAADLFVHPSACPEGLPTSVLEAGASGLPIVATPMGGTGEVLCSPEHGVLVSPRDPGALSEALGRLLADPDLASRLGENARQRVRAEFDWGRIAEAAEEELVRLLAAQPAREGSA